MALAVLALAALAAYGNSFAGPFVFDDRQSIAENPTLRSLWPPGAVLAADFRDGRTVDGRPVLNLSFAINHALGGANVWGYHVGNLLIHVLAGWVLFAILRGTFANAACPRWMREEALPLALFAALLWVVHPLQTAAVTYMAQRAESLMSLFYLLTLYCFLRGAESARGGRWFAAAVAACLLGVGTKEMMATAPLTVFLYDRTFLAGSFREAWRRRWPWHLALAATWIPLAWLIVRTGSRGGTAGFGTDMPWWHYALTQCVAVPRYLGLAAWPGPLVFDYGPGAVTDPREVLPQALLLAALGAATLCALWRKSVLGFAMAWVFLILAPSSTVVPSATQTIAEHRMYLPLAGLLVLAAAAVFRLAGRYRTLACGAIAGILIGLTLHRNEAYRTESGLWMDAAAKWPSNERAFRSAGSALVREGRAKEALPYFAEALRLKPGSAETLESMGNAYVGMKDYPAAVEKFGEALRIEDGTAGLHVNMASALLLLGRREEAARHFDEALRLAPEDAEAHGGMGLLLVAQDRLPEALEHFEKAVKAAPDSPEKHNNLGMALARAGRRDEALAQFREAVRLDPHYGQAKRNLAKLEKKGLAK